jgi:hypothetical protein
LADVFVYLWSDWLLKTFTKYSPGIHQFFKSGRYDKDDQQEKIRKNNFIGETKMNKTLLGIVIAVVVVVALGTAGVVYAQTSTPWGPDPDTGNGFMMGGRRGMMGAQYTGTQTGWLHDEMIAAYAEKLGISVDDLNARLAGGETMAQIAYSTGLTVEEFQTLMVDARSQALDQAVLNGDITQEQADWMKLRGAGMMGGSRGMRGTGQGQFANPGCPYYSQTQQ